MNLLLYRQSHKPLNAAILAVSEDRIAGFRRDGTLVTRISLQQKNSTTYDVDYVSPLWGSLSSSDRASKIASTLTHYNRDANGANLFNCLFVDIFAGFIGVTDMFITCPFAETVVGAGLCLAGAGVGNNLLSIKNDCGNAVRYQVAQPYCAGVLNGPLGSSTSNVARGPHCHQSAAVDCECELYVADPNDLSK